MALEIGPRSMSPDSDGRESPKARQWRNQLGSEEVPITDKQYRKYASGVDRALSLFDTGVQEWADYVSFLNRLLRALQARQANISTIPAKASVAKRLSQCLSPSLSSGVHLKALEVYGYVFGVIGKDGLSKDLPLYLPGLASVLSFASLSVRPPFLDLMERNFLELNPRSLRPALKSIILALLPGLEEETSEDFERTLKVMDRFRIAIRPGASRDITPTHSSGDAYFWQSFFLASITGHSRRPGALAYLVRCLPKLGHPLAHETPKTEEVSSGDGLMSTQLSQIVTTPEPGLLLRCFAAGLADEQLLIQRGFLDLLVTHLPLHSNVLQSRVQGADIELLLRAAIGVTTRRDMSLNRRLWTWLLGPEPVASQETDNGPESPGSVSRQKQGYFTWRTRYLEEYGLQPLIRALLEMIKSGADGKPSERARPYRICLSLMDRWEVGGLVVPEIFLPVIDSVREFESRSDSKSEMAEVLRSASVFFDGVESGLIYGELLNLMADALGPAAVGLEKRADKLHLVRFILTHFNVKEEEMVITHAPLTVLSILCMLEEGGEREGYGNGTGTMTASLCAQALEIAADLLELVPESAFAASRSTSAEKSKAVQARVIDRRVMAATPNVELLKKIKTFYVNEQGNLDATTPPLARRNVADLLLQRACALACASLGQKEQGTDVGVKNRILMILLSKTDEESYVHVKQILDALHECLSSETAINFSTFSSSLSLAISLFSTGRMREVDLSELVEPLVRQAWSFVAVSEPKYQVETVRSLWLLQTALGVTNRDIEAAICSLMVQQDKRGQSGKLGMAPSSSMRTFGVLWSQSLQDNASGPDRRGPRTPGGPNGDLKSAARLGGIDHYHVMLTRPVFLLLDALVDEKSPGFMPAKAWLNNLVGVEQLIKIFVAKLVGHAFLPGVSVPIEVLGDDGDLDLGIYYLRSLCNLLRWAPDNIWAILSKRTVSWTVYSPPLADLGTDEDVTMQEALLHICLRYVACDEIPDDKTVETRLMQLYRSALTVMHQILLNPHAEALAKLQLEHILVERLTQSLKWPDPYMQVLLLDLVFASLRLAESRWMNAPATPNLDKRPVGGEAARRLSVSGERPYRCAHPRPPPTLIKCIQAGLGSSSSRPVLDCWISFVKECLPFYSASIFQVLIPLVETLCQQIGSSFDNLQSLFRSSAPSSPPPPPWPPWPPSPPSPPSLPGTDGPETSLLSLLNGLEQILASGHDRLLAEEARAQVVKNPDQPQGFFGNMVSGVFSNEAPQQRSATANDRLTVLLAFQDAVRICFRIWSWGQGDDSGLQDPSSAASFTYTSLRMRNRARRLLEHLFAAETLECLETVVAIWRASMDRTDAMHSPVFNLLPALHGSRPRHTIPALFSAIYSRTYPAALDLSRRSTLTIGLQDTDLVIFLLDYARTLEDDAMDEIWQDCIVFLKELLANPFPHRQTLPSLLEFAAILGEKVDNTNFGEQRKMRRELADLFLRLLTAIFTTRPASFSDASGSSNLSEKRMGEPSRQSSLARLPGDRADDVVTILSNIVPNLPKILVESDRVLSAATAISANIIGPTLRSKSFPDSVSKNTTVLLQELSRLPNNQKSWKKDVADAFNDARFFGSNLGLVRDDWLPLLRQWTLADKERMPEMVSRIAPPTTAGIVFGVGATSARLEADRKTQLNLRRIATLILAAADDTFVADLPTILDKLVELLGASSTSSPSSTTRADVYMLVRALLLKSSPIHLAPLWPVINTELHAAISSVVAPDHSNATDTYNNPSVMQACKLLDLLVCLGPDDFQLHEWLFVTDTIDAVYPESDYQPVALVDELSEELGSATLRPAINMESAASAAALQGNRRRPLLGPGGIGDDVSMERRDELVAKVLRPFFGQLSIFAFESTYAMTVLDRDACVQGLLKDLFDERIIVKAL